MRVAVMGLLLPIDNEGNGDNRPLVQMVNVNIHDTISAALS